MDRIRVSRFPSALILALLACAVASAADAPIPRSQNVTINLIRRMVQRGLLPQSDADELIQMAEEDAAAARAEAVATQAALAKLSAAPAPNASTSAAPAAVAEDTVRVTYVPEIVKKQLREEIKQEVMTQAREERWADPRSVPEWATRYSLFGDIRFRFEGLYYPSGNDNTGAFPNFNTINTGAPFDVTGSVFSPQNNVDQQRQRTRLRVRFGADIDMGEDFTSGLRLATGENSSPVTTNQSLGASGGNFSKYAVWLDRAFIKYRASFGSATLGRFENPFFASQMLFDDDLGFDGLASQMKVPERWGLKPFVTLGAFPVFNSALNFSTIQPAKFKSQDKWLFAGQVGADLAPAKSVALKVGAAYYYYHNIAGRLSSPFTPVNAQDNGDTDETRPSFAQSGNTYFPLRNIIPGPLNGFGTTNQFQYFGLATPYHELAFTSRLDYNGYEPLQVSLLGEYVNNLAFDQGEIRTKAVNNLGPGGAGNFVGGSEGWYLDLRLGSAALTQRGDWFVTLGYRYVESDAVVDAFTDSDFGNGGTNLEGFTLGGAVALSKRTWLNLRWLSASSIAGPRYKNDTLQFDFSGKF